MKIGLMGLAFGSTNKGCEALGYGFLNVLQEIAIRRDTTFEVDIYEKFDVSRVYDNGNYGRLICHSVVMPGIGTFDHLKTHINTYKKDDIIFDFTAGDSFSDIYGMERFLRRTIIKSLAIKAKTPLVLGSQTYGPYKSFIAKKFAKYVITRSKEVFARDQLSCERVKKLARREAIRTVDVAFAMQYEKLNQTSEKLVIGFNPSGLLWKGGYNQNNQFGLTVNYPEYCRQVLRAFLSKGCYEIVLVPHVFSENLSEIDNDCAACQDLLAEFPELKASSHFLTPVEAKSYIAGLNGFTGARMHATIAAFTTGVPVLPFSYSPKFEGLYGSMNYNHIISGCKDDTETAVKKTLNFFENIQSIKQEMDNSSYIVQNGIKELIDQTEKVLFCE